MDTEAFLLAREQIRQRLEHRRTQLSADSEEGFKLFGVPLAPVAGFLLRSGLGSTSLRWLGGLAAAGIFRLAARRLRQVGWGRLASLL